MTRLGTIQLYIFLLLLGVTYAAVRFGGLPSRVLLLPVVILPMGLGMSGIWRWHRRRQEISKEAKKHEPVQP